ncbi:hypothetical protein HK104_011231, partial [Borealophlyctis nickersoniae]
MRNLRLERRRHIPLWQFALHEPHIRTSRLVATFCWGRATAPDGNVRWYLGGVRTEAERETETEIRGAAGAVW